MKNLIKYCFFTTLIMFSFPNGLAYAEGLYLATKQEFKFTNSDYTKAIHILRLGKEFKYDDWKLYGEFGLGEEVAEGTSLGSGSSFDAYKFGFDVDVTDSFEIEVKWEGKNYPHVNSSEIEIEAEFKF